MTTAVLPPISPRTSPPPGRRRPAPGPGRLRPRPRVRRPLVRRGAAPRAVPRSWATPRWSCTPTHALGFTDNRYWQFKRLADDLDRLPVLREAVATGEVGWTKAQQVARVATSRRRRPRGSRGATGPGGASWSARCREQAAPAAGWNAAQVSWRWAAAVGRALLAWDSRAPRATSRPNPPATITLRADGLQLARFEALVEKAHKLGLRAGRRRPPGPGAGGAGGAGRRSADAPSESHRAPPRPPPRSSSTSAPTAGAPRS